MSVYLSRSGSKIENAKLAADVAAAVNQDLATLAPENVLRRAIDRTRTDLIESDALRATAVWTRPISLPAR